jgi:hypothetical protein
VSVTSLAFSVTLLRPQWLLVLLAVPLFVWLALRASRYRPRAGDWAALVARTILLAALALALSIPRFETKSKGRAVAYAIDLSESMPPESLRRAQEFVRDSASLRGEDDDASLVVFADGAAVEAPFERVSASQRMETAVIDPLNVSTRLSRGETDIAAALRLARAGFPPGGSRRIVLLTDGNETRDDAAKAVKELLADHVDVQVVPVRYERKDEVLVEKLVAPAQAGTIAPAPLRVAVSSTADDVRAKIRFLVDDQEVVSREETLKRGTHYFEAAHRFETSGFHRVEVIVEPAIDGDPENNRGRAAVIVQGRGRVLVASNVPGSPLAAALRDNLDADVDLGGPDAVPADPGGFAPYDAVVLENVPAFALTDVQRRLVASAVRDLGVGLVCIGGPQTFGPGGYAGTELEAVLPVSSEIKNKRVLPSGALVVVLHTCEFAEGNAIARACTKAAVRALSSADDFGCIDFDMRDGDKWVVDLQRVGDKEKICSILDSAQPMDMPSLDSVVKMAFDGLKTSKAAVKHMLVISDGDPAMPGAKLVQQIVDEKITISAVCVEPHMGAMSASAMKKLAEENGGHFYLLRSRDTDKLPQIFVKEAVTVRRSAVKEEPFRPALRGLHRMLRDVGEDDLPPLLGYVVTTQKPEAELVLAGPDPDQDPVLSSWRVGLGQSVAWTSDASAWAREWAAWGGYGRFFAQVVKSSMRALNRGGLRTSTDVAGGSAHVALDALRADGSFANGLDVRASAIRPDGTTETFRVEQTGPGRYEGRFPAKQVGTYLATLACKDPATPDAPETQAMAAVCVAYSAEHLAQRSNERFFAVLESAGATLLDVDRMDDELAKDPKAPNARLRPWEGEAGETPESIELWPWIAGAAALLLVVDVAVRRVRVPWDKIFARRKKPVEGRPAPVIARGAPKPVAVGAFDPSAAAAAGETDRSAPPRDAPAPGPSAGPPPLPGDGGLLGAKKRAQKKQKWEENP